MALLLVLLFLETALLGELGYRLYLNNVLEVVVDLVVLVVVRVCGGDEVVSGVAKVATVLLGLLPAARLLVQVHLPVQLSQLQLQLLDPSVQNANLSCFLFLATPGDGELLLEEGYFMH